ncbi:MAG: hypothetical protein U1E27_10100, partial [Kiritimatiellia bacterium]|nr:hypothetical protein [Kiritimatiellia bacterium]
ASMTDAFGMCAQLPQVLIQAGFKTLIPGRMANLSPEFNQNQPFRWRGLDGSILRVTPFTGFVHHGSYLFNVSVTCRAPDVQLGRSLAAFKRLSGFAMGCYMTEEDLICEDLFWVLDAANRAGGRSVEFGRLEDFHRRTDGAPGPVADGEMNPVFTGCYTTRIGIKQQVRAAECRLADAEFMSALADRPADFDPLWRDLIRSQFHDAICGCHTDDAADILQNLLDRVHSGCNTALAEAASASAGGGITVYNPDHLSGPAMVSCALPPGVSPSGIPSQRDGGRVCFVLDLPPCGSRGVSTHRKDVPVARRISKKKAHRFETDFFEVSFHGADPVIRSKTEKRQIFAEKGFGEILFRADYGSMWTEALETDYVGAEYQTSQV